MLPSTFSFTSAAIFLLTVTIFLDTSQAKSYRKVRFPRQSESESAVETSGGDSDDDKDDDHVSLGNFDTYAHGVSGEVNIMDDRTIEINGFNYDGQGPAAWFMLGSESRSSLPEFTELEGTVIPDENENCDTLGRYTNSDIKLKLPSNMKVSDFTYLSIYCLRFNHNFGYVTIPSDMKLRNGTSKAGLEKCPDDDLAAAEQDSESTGTRRRPAPAPRPPPSQQESQGVLGGLLSSVVDFLG